MIIVFLVFLLNRNRNLYRCFPEKSVLNSVAKRSNNRVFLLVVFLNKVLTIFADFNRKSPSCQVQFLLFENHPGCLKIDANRFSGIIFIEV